VLEIVETAMLPNRGGAVSCSAALILLVACGEEVPRQPHVEGEQAIARHACELVTASELSQLFVGELAPVRDAAAGDTACTWQAAESGEAVFRYQVLPYIENLQAGVREFATGDTAALKIEARPGLGETAVWSDIGLFVSRDGRTLQLTPFDEEIPRAIYEELASLLLERLDSDR
jgi:hypothetical protein